MKRTLLFLFTFFAFYALSAQVVLNQVDDFEDGTTQSWRIGGAGNATAGPINITDGGPSGAGDNFLQYTSTGTGSVASKMVFYSQNNQWSGDFISAGADQMTMDVRVQTNDLNLRIAIRGTNNTIICSTNPINVTAGGAWSSITMSLNPTDFTVVSGGGTVNSVLSSASTLRILSSSAPTWDAPDIIAAVIQVDNITASSSLSINDFNIDNQFTISPNPAKSNLNIKVPNSNSDMKLEVFDVLGKRVYNGLITQLESSVNVSNWKSGIYLVRVSDNKSSQTKRFIKQ